MKYPPFLISLCLLFWGLETERLLIGLVLALLLEARLLISARYDLDKEDYVKISDLTSLIFIGGVALILLNYEPVTFMKVTGSWLPLLLSPLIFAQLYSNSSTVVIGTRVGKKSGSYSHKPIDFRIYYIVACLFGAAAGNSRSVLFYPLLVVILAYFLWGNRGRSYNGMFFFFWILLVAAGGYFIQQSVEQGYWLAIKSSHKYMRNYYRSKFADPFLQTVRFGDRGRMKSSGAIVIRLHSRSQPPSLLREMGYHTYRGHFWVGDMGNYSYIPNKSEQIWEFAPSPEKSVNKLQISYGLPKEKGILVYPYGTLNLESKTLFELEQNPDQNIKIVDGAKVVTYDISYGSEDSMKTETPGAKYLIVPEEESYIFSGFITQDNVELKSAAAKVEYVKRFFQRDFSYSLDMLEKGDFPTPLGNFVLGEKRGFCEYYGTATALFLRALGVPSRYVVGYSVSEKGFFANSYVIRKRDGHAWAEAWLGDKWVVVDTTPGNWRQIDRLSQFHLQFISDILNYLRHKYRAYQVGVGGDYTLIYSIIVVVLTSFLVVRIYRRMRLEKTAEEIAEDRSFERIVSPFTPVIDYLERQQLLKEEDESLVSWVKRIRDWEEFDDEEFEALYKIHLKVRFDPLEISEEDNHFLQQHSEKYVEQL